MVRLVCTNLDGRRLEVANLDDIVLDDYAAPTTLTVLRAQTQKVLVNSYASSIWEL